MIDTGSSALWRSWDTRLATSVTQSFRGQPSAVSRCELTPEQLAAPLEAFEGSRAEWESLAEGRLCRDFASRFLAIGRGVDNLLPDNDPQSGQVEMNHGRAPGRSQFRLQPGAEAFLLALPGDGRTPDISAYYQQDREGVLMGRRQGDQAVEVMVAPNGSLTIFHTQHDSERFL